MVYLSKLDTMSVQSVRKIFEEAGLSDSLLYSDVVSDTVESSAELIGCEPKQIAKTMLFIIDEKPIAIVTSGDAKIDNKKYNNQFRTKAKMIHFDEVEKYSGHIPGGVSPFGMKDGVDLYLDISLKRFDIVYAGGGDEHNTVKCSINQLEKYSNYISWIDVCKNWNEQN